MSDNGTHAPPKMCIRDRAQADSLRAAKKDVEAHRIESVEDKDHFTVVPGTELTRGDLVIAVSYTHL